MARRDDRQIIEAALAKLEPKLRRAVLEMLDQIATRRSTRQVAAMIQARGAYGTIDVFVDDARRAAESVAAQLHLAQIATAAQVMTLIGEAKRRSITFDSTTGRAIASLQRNKLRLVREVTAQVREVAEAVLRDGIARGLNPLDQARALRAHLGLTSRQWRAVRNYRRMVESLDAGALDRRLRDRRFDPGLRRALADGSALPRERVDRMVEAYSRRYVRYRAQMAARTESLRAVHEGAEEGWMQAIERGEIGRDEVVSTWHQTSKHRRDAHKSPMNGQKRRPDEYFTSNAGNRLRYPCDPAAPASETVGCRCLKVTRLV